jgi:hypothetical protein
MTDTVTPVVDEEAQALQQAQAGYDRKARAQAPAEPVVEQPAQPLAEPTPPDAVEETPPAEPTAPAEAETTPPPEPPEAALAKRLDDLKAQVKELQSSGVDAETVRKMHGDIGEINRTLKQLKALEKADAPAEDELAAALKNAEEVAQEYPEMAGPLVKAFKALMAKLPQPQAEPAPVAEPVAEEKPDPALAVRIAREQAAIDALNEVHPDRMTVKETPDFKKWFAAKTPEYQASVKNTWNPAVVSQCFTDYKAALAARRRKKEELDAAVTEKGVSRAGPTAISDEQAALIGYNRARGKRL